MAEGVKKTVKGFIGKAEFALMYNFSARQCSRFFQEHLEVLKATGYRKNSKLLSPKTLEAIFRILGPPEVGYEA